MKVKTVEMLILFDFYGDMLTDKQKELFDLYYNEDMSLAEISENTGITRQAVRDAIIRSEEILQRTERKLLLVKRYGQIRPIAEKILACFQDISVINENHYRNQELASVSKNGISLIEEILGGEQQYT